MPEERLDIVHMLRVEGLQSMSAAAYEFGTMRTKLELLAPVFIEAGTGLGGFSEQIATGVTANLGLITGGIAAAVVILPMLYNVIQQEQQRIREEFAESEAQILALATSFEIYEEAATRAAVKALPGPIGMPGGTTGEEAAIRLQQYVQRELIHTRAEWELYTWAVEASRGAIKDWGTEAEYIPQILKAIADEAAGLNKSLVGDMDNMALFFGDSEQDMIDHGGEVEKIQRQMERVKEQIQREGATDQLMAQRDALDKQLAAAGLQGEAMEEQMQRSMGKILLSQIDMMMKLGLDWETGWAMQEDVLMDYMGVSETAIENTKQMTALAQRAYLEGPEGAAWQQLFEGSKGMLPSIEGAQVTLPGAPAAPLAMLSDAVLSFEKMLAESLLSPGIATETALIHAAEVQLFAQEFGVTSPATWMDTGQSPTQLEWEAWRQARMTLPSKQGGGFVGETGAYLLHQGETVIPAGGGSMVVVNIENLYGTDANTAKRFGTMLGDEMRRQGAITR